MRRSKEGRRTARKGFLGSFGILQKTVLGVSLLRVVQKVSVPTSIKSDSEKNYETSSDTKVGRSTKRFTRLDRQTSRTLVSLTTTKVVLVTLT